MRRTGRLLNDHMSGPSSHSIGSASDCSFSFWLEIKGKNSISLRKNPFTDRKRFRWSGRSVNKRKEPLYCDRKRARNRMKHFLPKREKRRNVKLTHGMEQQLNSQVPFETRASFRDLNRNQRSLFTLFFLSLSSFRQVLQQLEVKQWHSYAVWRKIEMSYSLLWSKAHTTSSRLSIALLFSSPWTYKALVTIIMSNQGMGHTKHKHREK